MKKVITFMLTLVLLLTLTTPALASAPPVSYSSIPTEGIPAKGNIGSANGQLDVLSLSSTIHIYTWRNSIQEISSGYLKLYGLTETDWLADQVETDYYLQQWNGSSWVTYSTSFNYVFDTDYLELNIYRFVAHGYYYRLQTVHRGWLGSSYDTKTLYSSYIYVS